MQALIIRPGGEAESLDLPADEIRRLHLLQNLVGGYLEVVPVRGAKYLVFGEEVKDGPHVINHVATAIAWEAESIRPDDYLAGVVVVVPREALS